MGLADPDRALLPPGLEQGEPTRRLQQPTGAAMLFIDPETALIGINDVSVGCCQRS
jgi:hypothetical protein